MPIGLTAATLAGGAISGATSLFNTLSQGKQNRLNREFAEQQRQAQYRDQLDFWQRNNEYNHPSAQMARLREGGLNPHLVYGKGTVAGNTSSAPPVPQQAKWQGTAPTINTQPILATLDAFTNIKQKNVQTSNFREQNTLLKQEQELRKIGILQKQLDYDMSVDQRKAITEKVLMELDKMRTDIQYTEQKISSDMSRALQDVIRTNTGVLNSRVQRKLAAAGIPLRELQTKGQLIQNAINAEKFKLWEDGINPNDPVYIRAIASAIQNILGHPVTRELKPKN